MTEQTQYRVTINGRVYPVCVTSVTPTPQSAIPPIVPFVRLAAPASWVTARHTAHLPAR